MRTFKGNHPEGISCIARNQDWSLYLLRIDVSKRNFRYASLKLVSNAPCKGKANFWFQWSVGRVRVVKGREAFGLFQWHPETYAWVEGTMKREFGNNIIPFTTLHLIKKQL